jgi:hypothetical protein
MFDRLRPPRWVRAKTSGRAHLDLGECSSQSLRVRAEHVIVAACRAHLDPFAAEVVDDDYRPRCSNCQRIARKRATEADGEERSSAA